jgi:hypothetical protein
VVVLIIFWVVGFYVIGKKYQYYHSLNPKISEFCILVKNVPYEYDKQNDFNLRKQLLKQFWSVAQLDTIEI